MRKVLVFFFALCVSAQAAQNTVWDTANSAGGVDVTNAGKTVAGASNLYLTIVCSKTNTKCWTWHPFRGMIGSVDPVTSNPDSNVGGITPESGDIYGCFAVSTPTGGVAANIVTANFGASSFKNTMPIARYMTTFSSFNSATGSTVTLDPSNKGGNISLSNGNLTAQNTVVGFQSVRSTAALSGSQAGYWEVAMDATENSSNYLILGTMNSTETFTSYCGASSNSGGWQSNGTNNYGAFAAQSNPGNFTNQGNTPTPSNNLWTGIVATNPKTQSNGGKFIFEVTADAIGGTDGWAVGIAPTDWCIWGSLYLGGGNCNGPNGSSVGVIPQGAVNGIYACNVGSTTSSLTNGSTLTFFIDVGSKKLWVYNPNSGQYNNDALATPVTATGGIDLSCISSASTLKYYIAFATNTLTTASQGTLNTTGGFVNSVQVAAAQAVGYQAWDGSAARQRAMILP